METGTISEYLKFFAALLAIVNPVGVIPIFINLTADKAEGVRNKNGFMASISMGIILVIVLFTGDAILRFFGISVGSFRVGGGILILLMAISMAACQDKPCQANKRRGARLCRTRQRGSGTFGHPAPGWARSDKHRYPLRPALYICRALSLSARCHIAHCMPDLLFV